MLKSTINKISPISNPDLELLEKHLIRQTIPAEKIIHKSQEICDAIVFINEGSFRAYYVNEETLQEINLLLNCKNEFITDYESLITNTPSRLSIRAIEDSEVTFIPKEAILNLFNTSEYWRKFGEIISNLTYLNCKKRTEELLFLTPKERYLLLMKEKSNFLQTYPLKHISSYLGITPQSLSRIRQKLTQP